MINPRLSACFICNLFAVLLLAKENEDASAAMTDVDDVEDEGAEACQIILPLLGVLLKQN